MNYYDRYKHLLGIKYEDGTDDCYGLARRYYHDCYALELPNYARSADFFADGIDLVTPFLLDEGFSVVDVPLARLEVGDGLLMCVPSRHWPEGKINHVGVYVGNKTILHHLWRRPSCDDPFDIKWQSRVLSVIRHPSIAEKNAVSTKKINVLDVLPDYVKQRYNL